MLLTTGEGAGLRDCLMALDGAPVDAIAVPVEGRRKRLLLADMDSTIVTSETLDEIADMAGLKAEGAEVLAQVDLAGRVDDRVNALSGGQVRRGCAASTGALGRGGVRPGGCAPAQPRPQNSVTFFAPSRRAASAGGSPSEDASKVPGRA